jgi:glycosyltransferase involved in cell wall biosynthesis
MRVIILSWEYPPRVVGKLSDYVKALSTQLAAKKVDVNIVTYDSTPSQKVESDGVKTIKVSNPVQTHIGVLTWVLTLNEEVERAAARAYYEANKQVDIVNVYDWHFIPAAATLRNGLGIPFVYSVESLEDHRSNSANTPYNMAIKSIEWLGFYEASVVTVKSRWMLEEVVRIYKVPRTKIKVISANADDMLSLYVLISGGSKGK